MPPLSRRARFLIFALFLGAVLCSTVNILKESDSFYHLAVGRLILETGSIPHADPFSLSARGVAWITHEWLAEVLFFLVFTAAGYWGLMIFVALTAATTYAVLLVLVRRLGGELVPGALILLGAGALTFELWIPRPQIFAYLFFTLLLFVLDDYRRTRRRRMLAFAVIIIVLWANMHASVVLGLAVFALFYAVERLTGQKGRELDPVLLAAFAGAFANPNGFATLTYSAAINSGVRALDVLEWRSILFFWNSPEAEFVVAGILLAGYAAWLRFGVRERRDFWWLGLVIASGALPFFAVRHVGFAVVPLGVTLAVAGSEPFRKLPSDLGRVLYPAALAIFSLIVIGRLVAWPVRFAHPATVPLGAAEYLLSSGARGALFNFYGDGGYLLWRLYPAARVFIDGRSEVFAGRPTEEYFAILDGTAEGRRLVDEVYGFTTAVLPYRDPLVAPAARRFFGWLLREGWVPVFWDDASLVLVRPTTEHRDLVARDAISFVSPFRSPEQISEAQAPAAEREVLRLRSRVPDSAVLADYLARLRSAHPALGSPGAP